MAAGSRDDDVEITDSIRSYLRAFDASLRAPDDPDLAERRREAFTAMIEQEIGIGALRADVLERIGREELLTATELRVLHLRLRGLGLDAIAMIMHISPSTVDKHSSAIFRKAGTSNPFLLAEWATEQGLW